MTSIALVLANGAIYAQTYLTAWSGQHLVARLRVRLFDRLLNLPLGEFDRWRPGELIARFATDLQIMIDAVSVSVPQLVVALATFVSSFVTMVYLDWLLTLSLVLVAPVVSIAVSNFQRLIAAGTQRTQQRIADLTANLSETLQGHRVVKSFGREQYEIARFRTRNRRFLRRVHEAHAVHSNPAAGRLYDHGCRGRSDHVDERARGPRRTLGRRQSLHVLGPAGQPHESDEPRRGLLRRYQQGTRRRGARLRTARSAGRSARSARARSVWTRCAGASSSQT